MNGNLNNAKSARAKLSGKTRYITVTAILSAVSAALMFFSFSVPFVPSFIKMDFSELPALIGSFAFGPICGVLICLIKNLINLAFTTTGGIGELCNFLLGAAFVLPAGIIYKYRKNFSGAIIAALSGCAVMAVSSLPINYFITYPVYIKLFMPLDTILSLYQAICPSINSLLTALLVFNLPFTFIKGLADCIITFLIYKKLSPILKGH